MRFPGVVHRISFIVEVRLTSDEQERPRPTHGVAPRHHRLPRLPSNSRRNSLLGDITIVELESVKVVRYACIAR